MFKKITSFVLCLCMLFGVCAIAASAIETDAYGFIETTDGVKIEYGIYGSENAQPLVLLPCNGADMHGFDGNVLPELQKHYKVICISPRGTGKSDRGSGRLTFEVMADDLKAVLDALKIEKTYIFGFSDGGNLGLVFTHIYPQYVEKLAIMGANINMFGTNPWDEIEIIFNYLVLCFKAFFTHDSQIALERDIEGMMVGQPRLTFYDISKIKIPVLNIYGEHDMIMRAHSKLITKAIPNCEELMIIGGGHSTCFKQTDEVINPALLDFFGADKG